MKIICLGGSSDIGQALIKELIKNNEIISTFYSNDPNVQNKKITSVYLDLSSIKSIDEFVDSKISSNWDCIIFLSATLKPIGLFNDNDPKEWLESININFTNQIYLLNKLLKFKNSNKKNEKSVIFCAGPGTNNPTTRHSSYTVSKIALIKLTELLDYEIQDIKFSIIGPGWVNTKIHDEIIEAGSDNSGPLVEETTRRRNSNDFNSIDKVVKSFVDVLNLPKNIVGGKNISTQNDKINNKNLLNYLDIDKDIYKLRRDFNDFKIDHDLNFNIEDIINIFSSSPKLQNPNSLVYKFFKRLLIFKFNNIFENNNTLKELFGFQIDFPMVRMGSINSAHLFGIDELFILDFYIRNKSKYKTACDIGCNIGLHSLFMHLCGFSVTSFEPDPIHFSIIEKNLSKFTKKVLFNKAVSNYDGKATFTRIINNTTGSYINDKKTSYGPTDKFEVEVLDSKNLSDRFDLMKIDAEGSEMDILENFTETHFNKTDIIMEVSTQESREDLWKLINKFNLNVYSQKISWEIVKTIEDLPLTHREGSIFLSSKNKFI